MRKTITMKRMVLILALCMLVFSGCRNAASNVDGEKVEIVVRDMGTIVVQLNPSGAPITTKNFLKLVNEKFYDGLIFHRVIPNFMVQGGDPDGTGGGGSDVSIKGEFSSNGVENNLEHKKGVISMARRGDDPDSASSQFFITVAEALYLDGDYASFGVVLSGQEVADAISNVPRDENDKPLSDIVIESIRVLE
jgi:peptidyl-prolyl cis-trans isomerase B (cyclophilin B)